MTKYFDPKVAFDLLKEHIGGFVGITFTKRTDGSERQLNGSLNCRRYVSGVGMSYDPAEKGLLVVWDAKIGASLPEADRAKAYRSVPLDSISCIKCKGRTHLP